MQIKVAKTAGFCFGVNRAVDMIYKMLADGKKVATLGPIIHNDSVVNDLKSKGAVICSSPEEVPEECTLVIRTHGVGEDIIKRAEKCSGGYVNATCPFVQKIHKIVKSESEKGNIILIAGDDKHPEVEGIKGHCVADAFVFSDCEHLDKIMEEHPEFAEKAVSVVSQTTFSVKEWQKCVKKIKLVYTNAVVFDTICNATEERQAEAAQLSKECDLMIVVGGRASSNTAKLVKVCSANCKTYHVETADELKSLDFAGFEKIGVTAGASTPACIIKEVLQTMSEILENKEVIEADAENKKEEAVSMDEMSFSEALEESLKNLTTDQTVKGEVVGISPNEVQVDIGRKHAGYVPLSELTNDPSLSPEDVVKVGDVIDLIIMKTNDAEGTVMLSKRRYDAIKAWDDVVKASEEGTILEGTVTDVIKGGVLVVTGALRVFVPASLATASRGEPLENLLKTKVRFKVIEVNKQRRRAVGSIRAVLKEERKAAEEAFWADAEEGRTYTGTVKSLTSYGAFVDIGGVDGMIHISELSWNRIKHPSEVVNVGDTVEVYIKALDRENKKISLGYKKVEDNPWEILRRDYPVGTVVDAKIVGITAFGAFAQVIPGIDGLIHISQLSTEHVEKPQDVVKGGDVVKVKITNIDFDKKRVSLSMKEAMAPAGEAAEEATDAE